jgi:hypothetical protein
MSTRIAINKRQKIATVSKDEEKGKVTLAIGWWRC